VPTGLIVKIGVEQRSELKAPVHDSHKSARRGGRDTMRRG
jgi:hypothetical protein